MKCPATCLVVTPVRNAESQLAETMRSVLSQSAVTSGRARLRYVVVDGASDDGTASIAHGFEGVEVISEPDLGLYDALRKGFDARDEDPTVCAYLNAGDLWHPTALDVVLDIFEQRADVEWVTGYRAAISPEGYYVHVAQPFAYRRNWIRDGVYGTYLPSIQQESTFWRGHLLREVDTRRLSEFRLAGDQYLWSSFAKRTRLHVVCALLGGFRMHPDHLSQDRNAYRAEGETMLPARRPRQARLLIDRLMWSLPDRMKKIFAGANILSYREASADWSPPAQRLLDARRGQRGPSTQC
jgi:glycosyltransferase involved in cell wall biosynthesis